VQRRGLKALLLKRGSGGGGSGLILLLLLLLQLPRREVELRRVGLRVAVASCTSSAPTAGVVGHVGCCGAKPSSWKKKATRCDRNGKKMFPDGRSEHTFVFFLVYLRFERKEASLFPSLSLLARSTSLSLSLSFPARLKKASPRQRSSKMVCRRQQTR
jgi:hypothetical protein